MENMASLFLVQGANYILPLVTFPYLVRVLSIEKFGLIAFAVAFIQYFVVFVDYGFNLTATREISINRNDFKKVSKIFWEVYAIKFILMLLSFGILVCIVAFIPRFKVENYLFFICFLAVWGNFLFPIWFFQGIEKIKLIAVFNLVAKIMFTIAIFVFVKNENDYLKAAALQTGGVLFAGVGAFIYAVAKYPIKFALPKYSDIKRGLREGQSIFMTIMSSTLVNSTNIFILGLFADNKTVGIFAIADKIVRVFINMCGPISSAIFPRVSKLFSESREKALIFIKKMLIYGIMMFLLLCILLFISADYLVSLITGENIKIIAVLIRIMAIVPLTIFIDNLYGTQVLINIGRENQFMKAVLIPGVISIIMSFIFVPLWKYYATAIIFVVSEMLVLVMMIYYANKNNIYLIHNKIV